MPSQRRYTVLNSNLPLRTLKEAVEEATNLARLNASNTYATKKGFYVLEVKKKVKALKPPKLPKAKVIVKEF